MCGGNILLHCTYSIHYLGAKKEVKYEKEHREIGDRNEERKDQETAEQSNLIASYNHFMSILIFIRGSF